MKLMCLLQKSNLGRNNQKTQSKNPLSNTLFNQKQHTNLQLSNCFILNIFSIKHDKNPSPQRGMLLMQNNDTKNIT